VTCVSYNACPFLGYISDRIHSVQGLRLVGGDEKGSLKSETVKYGRKSQGTTTEKDCAGKASGTYNRQTRPLVREGVPRNEECNCQTYSVFRTEKKSGRKPRMGALYQDRLAD
jgi:hypothetical protein